MTRHGLVVLLLVCLATTGCINFTGTFGTPIATEHLSKIVDGETTRAQITLWFGPPSAFYNPTMLDVVLEDDDDVTGSAAPILNDVYTYRFIENDSSLFFIPIFYARLTAEAASETLTIFFDERGVVKYHAYRKDLPGGGAP